MCSHTCPKCKRKMKVTNTYAADGCTVRRLRCACGKIVVTQETVVRVDPVIGEGASDVVRRRA